MVSAPTEMISTPASAKDAHLLKVHAARDLQDGPAGRLGDSGTHVVEVHVVEQDER